MTAPKIAFAAAICLALSSCGGSDANGDSNVLLVSIEPQQAILQEIAGDAYEVVTLLPNGADPETYDPPMSVRRQAERARLYFATGAFPFEHTMASLTDAPAIFATDSLPLIYGTHGECNHQHGHEGECSGHHHHHDAAADPHIWTSISNMKTMAGIMTRQLSALNPDSASVYAARTAILTARLDTLNTRIRRRLENAPSRAFAIWHPSLSYFARDYGLTQHAVGVEGKEMSVSRVRHAIDLARADSVRVFFMESGSDQNRAATFAREIGASAVEINLMDRQWEQQLQNIANELARP